MDRFGSVVDGRRAASAPSVAEKGEGFEASSAAAAGAGAGDEDEAGVGAVAVAGMSEGEGVSEKVSERPGAEQEGGEKDEAGTKNVVAGC